MSKLAQLCSFLERSPQAELVFVAGAMAVLSTPNRDMPVTVAPLSAATIARFFGGTSVGRLLATNVPVDESVRVDVGGEKFECHVCTQGSSIEVRIRKQLPSRTAAPWVPGDPAQTREARPRPTAAPPPPPAATTQQPRPGPAVPPVGNTSPTLLGPVPHQAEQQPQTAPLAASAPGSPAVRPQAASPAAASASTGRPPGLGQKLAPNRPVRPAAPRIDALLRYLIETGASDLHLSSGSVPSMRLHGKMQRLEQYGVMAPETLAEILLEIADDDTYRAFVESADADFAHEIHGLARFRANYFADRHGMGAVFRQIPLEILSPEKIGLPTKVLDLCWLSKGLVLVTGPTGSGKSTTLASMVDFINRNRDDHIITIEDPIEFVHENKRCLVNQREVGRHTKSFKSALRAALREDPDVILVGELRDLETIAIALETAETGHLVFGTLHTTTAPSTVDRIIDQFPADQQAQIRTMLGSSLRGVIGQTLLPKRGGGRVAAYEVLLHTHAIGNLIREGKTHQLQNAMQTGKNLGMQNLNDHLLRLTQDGIVEAREAYIKAVDKANLGAMFQKAGIPLEMAVDAA